MPPAVPWFGHGLRETAWREGADPCGDYDGSRRESVGAGLHDEMLAVALEADHVLVEVTRLSKLCGLRLERLHEILGEHLRKAGDVEDVLLGIQRRELSTNLRERVEHLGRRAAHPTIKESEEARGPSAKNSYVFDLVLHRGEIYPMTFKIYTKTGDRGMTGLFGGGRVSKDDDRVEAYGDVDELNAVLGVVCSTEPMPRIDAVIEPVQRDLFAIGAILATPNLEKMHAQLEKARIDDSRITELELAIDACDTELPPLTAFILPGGTAKASALHVARTVCRRRSGGDSPAAYGGNSAGCSDLPESAVGSALFVGARGQRARRDWRGDVVAMGEPVRIETLPYPGVDRRGTHRPNRDDCARSGAGASVRCGHGFDGWAALCRAGGGAVAPRGRGSRDRSRRRVAQDARDVGPSSPISCSSTASAATRRSSPWGAV